MSCFAKKALLLSGFFLLILIRPLAAQQLPEAEVPWYYRSLNLTQRGPGPGKRPIRIAIVDDAFKLDHPALKPFFAGPPGEIPGNGVDDDGNGHVDDSLGWDLADDDPDVRPPAGRDSVFYHGSYLCGMLVDVLRAVYGSNASQLFELIPVKVLSDQARQTYLLDGYRGVAYALTLRPDLIVCAWNGGRAGPEEEKLFSQARKAGIAVVAAAGNAYGAPPAPPASLPEVVAVAAVDENLRKTPESNHGFFVDLAGPGRGVRGAGITESENFRLGEGSSAATAVIAACLAILKEAAPSTSLEQRLAALQNTALPLERYNPVCYGGLGSGFPNLKKALEYLTVPSAAQTHQSALAAGILEPRLLPAKMREYEWHIEPQGAYQGFWFELAPTKPGNAQFQLFSEKGNLVSELPQGAAGGRVFIAGNSARVRYLKKGKKAGFSLVYRAEPIDSARLFCKEVKYLENPRGEINDGSAEKNYANGCDCRWQIQLPAGQQIRLRFKEFDTEAKTDFLYVFAGDSTIPANLLAKFSGPSVPPEIIVPTHQVLLWFVSDGKVTGKGWSLEYESVP